MKYIKDLKIRGANIHFTFCHQKPERSFFWKEKQFPSLSHMQGQRKTLARIGQVRASMAMHVRQQTSPAKVHGLMPTLSRPMSRLQPRRPLRGHQIPTEEVLQSTVAQLIPWPSQQMAQSSNALSSVYSSALDLRDCRRFNVPIMR